MDRAAKDSIRGLVDVLFWGAAVALIVALAFFGFFRLSPYKMISVHGPSMQPTLTDGDLIILRTTHEIKRNQIAVFDLPKQWADAVAKNTEANLIKRVVGLPGDELNYNGSEVTISSKDGKTHTLKEPKLSGCELTPGSSLTVPKGKYFLAGDNRIQSFDSMAAWCSGLDPLVSEGTIGINGSLQQRFSLFSF